MIDKGVRIRPGRADEIERLRLLDRAARSRYAALSGFEYPAEAPLIAADRLTDGVVVVAEGSGNVLLGFALTQPLDDLLYLANISVAPHASGRGIGQSLLARVSGLAHEGGLPAVMLATFKAPPWNGPWFRKQGFTPMPAMRIGPGLQAVLDRHAAFIDMTTRETLWTELA